MAHDTRGRIWFTELLPGKLGMLDPTTGKLIEFPVPAFYRYATSVSGTGCCLRYSRHAGVYHFHQPVLCYVQRTLPVRAAWPEKPNATRSAAPSSNSPRPSHERLHHPCISCVGNCGVSRIAFKTARLQSGMTCTSVAEGGTPVVLCTSMRHRDQLRQATTPVKPSPVRATPWRTHQKMPK